MKIRNVIVALAVIAQHVLFLVESRADIGSPVTIINGKSMSFNTNTADNWFAFTLARTGNILISGSDSNGSYIFHINIYDESLDEVVSKRDLRSESFNLNAGRYYLVLSDASGGTFSVYSKQMTNPIVTNPPSGSILNPIFPGNGISRSFSTNIETNVYYFGMKSSGNLLISGSDSNGSYIFHINIYDESLAEVVSKRDLGSESFNLNAGRYYLVLSDASGGTFSVFSTQLFNPLAPPPEPPPTKINSMPWLFLLLSD